MLSRALLKKKKMFSRTECLSLLKQNSAKLAAMREPETEKTFLHLACEHSWTEILRVFATQPISLQSATINCRDALDSTPLHICCRKGAVCEARLCLECGADPNVTNIMGWTPLMTAAGAPSNGVSMMRLLRAYGADPRLGSVPLCFCITAENSPGRALMITVPVTDMHFFESLSGDALVERLRSGRHIAHRTCFARSTLDVAKVRPDTDNCELVLAAARPWTTATHYLWPPAARRRARELALVAYLLAFHNSCPGMLDVWLDRIIPMDLGRRISGEMWAVLLVCVRFTQTLRRSRRCRA